MNPPTPTPDEFSSLPLEFIPFLPLPIQTTPTPIAPAPAPAPALPNPNAFLSFPIPKKRRRGRPQKTQTTFHFPQFFPPNAVQNQQQKKTVSDISEEIIVINKESTNEALIGLSAGFPADSLTDEEIDARVVTNIGGIEQVNYILIRNHIIAKWRENVNVWVTKEMFIHPVLKHLDSAYNYLVSHGYIYFGVSQSIKEQFPNEYTKSNVIVVGAGLAGLSAARQLISYAFIDSF